MINAKDIKSELDEVPRGVSHLYATVANWVVEFIGSRTELHVPVNAEPDK